MSQVLLNIITSVNIYVLTFQLHWNSTEDRWTTRRVRIWFGGGRTFRAM